MRRDARHRPRTVVRKSGVHGRGVYANVPIAAGERIIEYRGDRISWVEGDSRYPVLHDTHPHHTFLFTIEDDVVIDGGSNGNSARLINHSCAPNCQSVTENGRVFIHALRDIEPGEELFYDYRLVLDGPRTPDAEARYACGCGASTCRGTMLEPPKKQRAG